MENKEIPIWILVGSEYDKESDEMIDISWTYALAHNHLPHGGWSNQGLNERAICKFYDIKSTEVSVATNNTRLYIEEQIKEWGFILEFSEELDQTQGLYSKVYASKDMGEQ